MGVNDVAGIRPGTICFAASYDAIKLEKRQFRCTSMMRRAMYGRPYFSDSSTTYTVSGYTSFTSSDTSVITVQVGRCRLNR